MEGKEELQEKLSGGAKRIKVSKGTLRKWNLSCCRILFWHL